MNHLWTVLMCAEAYLVYIYSYSVQLGHHYKPIHSFDLDLNVQVINATFF